MTEEIFKYTARIKRDHIHQAITWCNVHVRSTGEYPNNYGWDYSYEHEENYAHRLGDYVIFRFINSEHFVEFQLAYG